MSKEMKRKKALRLQVKRGSFLVATLASVAVSGLNTVGAEEVSPTGTQPNVEVSSTTNSVSSSSEISVASAKEVADSNKTTEAGDKGKAEEAPKEAEELNKPKGSSSEVTSKPDKKGSEEIAEFDKGKDKEKENLTSKTEASEEKPKSDSDKEKEEPKETPKDEPKETPKDEPKETPKEESKEEPKEEGKVDEDKPKLNFGESSTIEQVGQNYLVNSDTRLKASISNTKKGMTDLRLVQKLSDGSVEEHDPTDSHLLPVTSTLELRYKDSEGKNQVIYLGSIEDKSVMSLNVVKSENHTVELKVSSVVEGDSLPSTLSATSSDGKYKLTGVLGSDNTYTFDGSVLSSGNYTFSVDSNDIHSTFGRRLGSATFELSGVEPVVPTPTPEPNPSPVPTPIPTPEPSPSPLPTPTPGVDTPTTPNNGNNHDVTPPTPSPVPTPPTPSTPSEVPSTDNQGGGGVVVNPSTPNTNTSNGNTNNGGNVAIGGVSDKTNYVESPNKLTVGVSDGSVRNVKATVSSQAGTTELTGRVVDGSFVADNLPERDGVYTVKVQVTDDKGQVSEKTITYAVNKNGSTYNWLNKDVNGAYYQSLSEDLKLSEHSTTRLDTSKTKFTFTLDGKVVSLDSRQVNVVEKKEDDGSYTYTYTFDKNAFKENGVWSISVATVDVDGHASSSNASVQFQFVLDNIAPELKIEGILNNGKYDAAKYQFKVLVKDNIGLARVRVLINGKVYEFTRSELEKGEKILDLEHSDKPYTIEVEVVDLAGNTTTQKVDGVTVTASDIQALLHSDAVKLAVGVLGVGAVVGLLAWWGASVRKRKALEEELERYRIGAHLVTEAEGILSSSGGSSAEDTGLTESEIGSADVGSILAEEVALLNQDSGSIETSGKLSMLGTDTEVLDADNTEQTATVGTEPLEDSDYTSVLSSEDEEPELTTVLDSGKEEHTSLLVDDFEGMEEQTSVLGTDELEQTTVLDSGEEEHTSLLVDNDEEHTSLLVEEEDTAPSDSEEHTDVLKGDSEK